MSFISFNLLCSASYSDKELITEIEKKITSLRAEMEQQNIFSLEYINNNKDYIDRLSSRFKNYVDWIYQESRIAGVSIDNNNGSNKIRFNINAEIKGEGSAGINNVRTFCIDMLYLTLKNNHSINFIYHDSTIFSETDPRQVYNMFKLAKTICDKYNVQYIVNLNYNIYDMLIHMAKNEYKESCFAEYLKSNVIITLLDDKPSNKLLGIEIP